MEVKNLFDPAVKQDILGRLDKLTPQTQGKWGKMNVSQMLAHCQAPINVGMGNIKLKRGFLGYTIGPLIKKVLYGDKPFKQGLPTAKEFVMKDDKDFETEKAKLLALINSFKEENITVDIHPLFGKLTREQWSKATYKHLDHHLQQFGV